MIYYRDDLPCLYIPLAMEEDQYDQKFGDRILPGGDLYDKERKWFLLTDSRPETYVTDWLDTVDCPVIRIDGTLSVEENVDYLVSVLAEEDN